jgi:peroxiredoxin
MRRRRALYLLIPTVAGALVAFIWLQGRVDDAGSRPDEGVRPAFTLPDLSGRQRSITEWDGQVLVVNFWATWCPPCVEEIPELVAVQSRLGDRGLQVIGVAADDLEQIEPFLEEVPVNYPVLHGVADGFALLEAYGNDRGTLPYTVIVDRDGIIRRTVPRAVDAAELEGWVRPLL